MKVVRWLNRKSLLLLVALSLFLFIPYAGAETSVSYTGQVHPELPVLTLTVTDTGIRTDDSVGDNILQVTVAAQDGSFLQQITWESIESPAFERIIPLVRLVDMNFDGYGDLVLLTAQGARNVFTAISLWNEATGRFRPVEQQPVWDSAAKCLTFETHQLELCNSELSPQEKRIYSVVEDGFRYRTETVYEWESRYGLTVRWVADVYDAGENLIGETVVQYATQLMRCWDAMYPEEWYYGQDDVAFERQTAIRSVLRGGAISEPALLQVANVDWVNLRYQDSKSSPSLAKLNAGEIVYGLVFGCGIDNGWTLVWWPADDLDTLGQIGYIWHSFLEVVE